MRNRVFVTLPVEALAKLLHLRADVRIVAAKFNHSTEALELYVAGDAMPKVSPGEESRRVNLTYLTDPEIVEVL